MSYRVIQWGTGTHGHLALRGILDHPELELAGVKVHSGSKHGQDAGALCGRPDTGILASNKLDDMLSLDADCVVYMPLLPDKQEVIALLRSGKNVIASNGWFYEGRRDFADVEAAAMEGKVSLHGTGIHPGGITEKLPLVASALITNIRFMRGEEFSDIRTYDAPDVVTNVMLFGKPVDEVRNSPMLHLLGDGFCQSVDMMADAIGVTLDEDYSTEHRYSVATADIDTPFGKLEKDTVAAQHFSWSGTVRGTPVIQAAVNWYMGHDHLEEGWVLGKERFEMQVDGDNRIQLVTEHLHHEGEYQGGVDEESAIVATGVHCVNSVPAVCEAAPGLCNYLNLPLVTGKAAADLR